MNDFREVKSPGKGEYVEKKSKFLSVLEAVYSEEDALRIIEETKKKHYDARHVCSAYVLMNDAGDLLTRFSDDGEPSGTAGKPILETLEGAGIVNGIITVTRYFGGTLLGTGGLVRAYTAASKEAVENAALAERISVYPLTVEIDYSVSEKLKHLLRTEDIPVTDTIYDAKVIIKAMVPTEKKEALEGRITELSSGGASLEWEDQTGFLI